MKAIRTPIIGVFGSDELASMAFEIGQMISNEKTKRPVLLTGGNGDGESVKDKAIQGAVSGGGRWIGVVRLGADGEREPDQEPKNSGFLLKPALGHRRNYLEACLCDVAIALRGGPGTSSEVVSCLSLDKPVVLIGPWTDWATDAEAIAELIPSVSRLTSDSYSPTIDALDNRIKELEETLSTKTLIGSVVENNHLIVRTGTTQPNEIVKVALERLGTERRGKFPNFLGNSFAKMKSEFENWLG